MANQKSDFDYIKWILNKDFISDDQSRMSELKAAHNHKPHIVKIIQGKGVTGYELYEFGHKENKDLLPFFNNTFDKPPFPNAPKGLIRFCDYVILAEFKGHLHIILVEMKRGNQSGDEARLQLDAAKTFMDYVLASAERIKGENSMEDFDRDTVEFRRVILEKVSKEPINSHRPLSINDYILYKLVEYFDIRRTIGR